MIWLLTVLTVFIAAVLTVLHWRAVREVLLWVSAGFTLLAWLLGALAFLAALVLWIWAAVAEGDSRALALMGGLLAATGFGLFAAARVLVWFEERDRERQFAAFRAGFSPDEGKQEVDRAVKGNAAELGPARPSLPSEFKGDDGGSNSPQRKGSTLLELTLALFAGAAIWGLSLLILRLLHN